MGEDVEKSLYLSYTEILKGLHFIKDAIDFVEQGKDYYVILYQVNYELYLFYRMIKMGP